MYTVHSLSQEIEDLAGAPWTAEEEEVVRRVEREAFRSSEEEVKRMANEPWTEEEEAVASQVEQTALRSSSAEVEALASAPWSSEEEEAVRMVEMRAMGVQGAAIPSNDGSVDSLARRIITPSVRPADVADVVQELTRFCSRHLAYVLPSARAQKPSFLMNWRMQV